jgi:hypothetical protein
MMSESAVTTPRREIVADPTSMPPWASLKVECANCFGRVQLEAADHCEEAPAGVFRAPACPTCGIRNVIDLRPGGVLRALQRLLAIGLESEPDDGEEGCLGAT